MTAVAVTFITFPDFQASYLTKTVALGMKRVDLAIWDTAGQEMFHALGPLYYRLVTFEYLRCLENCIRAIVSVAQPGAMERLT